jgi:hypothetical protein
MNTDTEQEYAIWDYTKQGVTAENKCQSPFHLNFNDASKFKQSLPLRTWLVGGLVVKKMRYGQYDQAERKFTTPLIKERWYWELDPATDMVTKRTIEFHGYNRDGKMIPTLNGEHRTVKVYVDMRTMLHEMTRRRFNKICDFKEALIMAGADKGLGQAINECGVFVNFMHDVIVDYIYNGGLSILQLLDKVGDEDLKAQHNILHNEISLFGFDRGCPLTVLRELVTIKTTELLTRTTVP